MIIMHATFDSLNTKPLAPPSDDEVLFGAEDAAGLDLGTYLRSLYLKQP